MSQMRIWANPEQTIGVGCARTLITPIGHDSPLASRVTEPGGSTAWDELCPQANTPYIVSVEAAGFAPFSERFNNIFEDIDITLTPSGGPGPTPPSGGVSRLSLSGSDLVNAAGQRTFLRGSNSFVAFEEWLKFGEARLKPVAQELQQYRVNCARIWSINVNVNNFDLHRPPFDPRNYPNYYTELRPFTQFWASYGIWIYWGIFPDVQLISSDVGWQQGHWDALHQETDQEDGTFGYEFQNEAASKDYNRVSYGFQHRSPSRPWTGTSYSPDDPAYNAGTFPTAAWNSPMGDLHPARVYPAQILDSNPANNVYVTHNLGLIIGEGDRFGEGGNPNARQAEQCANATRACAIGTILHTNKGKWAMRLDTDPTTKNCADRYFGGFGYI